MNFWLELINRWGWVEHFRWCHLNFCFSFVLGVLRVKVVLWCLGSLNHRWLFVIFCIFNINYLRICHAKSRLNFRLEMMMNRCTRVYHLRWSHLNRRSIDNSFWFLNLMWFFINWIQLRLLIISIIWNMNHSRIGLI